MELLAKLQEEMKISMKSGQKDRLTVIRMLISEVKNIDLQPTKPTPQQAVEGYAKKIRKNIEEYEKLGKTDVVTALKSELLVCEEFLPKKLDKDATEKLIDTFLAANNFTEKQIGQAMGMFIKANGATVEPGIVNAILKAKLAGK